jgi:hypothetical protein
MNSSSFASLVSQSKKTHNFGSQLLKRSEIPLNKSEMPLSIVLLRHRLR